QHNGFEQFVINYCNEKLQQVFILLTLKEEQEEYVREGIQWSPVEFFDNSIICDLIENGSRGILAMLDEECLRPGAASTDTLLRKLQQACGAHGRYESRETHSARRLHDASLPAGCFRVHHYAGKVGAAPGAGVPGPPRQLPLMPGAQVTYDASGFVEKNTDLLFRDLSQAVWAARQPLLRGLFPEGDPRRASLRLPPTAASQVKASVGALMRNLYSKNPNYIRCIKPNESKAPMVLVPELVLAQIRYLGLLENVRVRRAGYAFRQHYGPFLERYKMLCARTWPRWEGGERRVGGGGTRRAAGVETLLSELPVPAEELAFGHSKLFIRSPRTLFDLERRRQERLAQLATLIQAAVRGWRCRTRFQLLRRSQIRIAACFRGHA
ncbi:MYO1A protein, partial [Nothoprocta ornata]|nr:MYO1A protein [Nothoprocta ornata]